MQKMTHYCCQRYWLPNNWLPNTQRWNCETNQLAYWLWLPGNLANGRAFNNHGYFGRLQRHIDTFDPRLQNEGRRAQMCNCGHNNNNNNINNNNPVECTHQLQANGVHPSSQNNQGNAAQTDYPFFAWPTTKGL